MIKPTKVLLLGFLCAAQNAFAIQLNEQIQQNVEQAQKSYEKLIKQQQPSLWIQVRTEQQRELLQHIADWLKPVSLIKIEPIQLVKKGPKKSQLRFFSNQDKQKADDLFQKLQKIFPQLELQDLSAEYGAMSWMEEGHFELWLAPDLKKIEPPADLLPPAPPVIPAPAPMMKVAPPTAPAILNRRMRGRTHRER